jgi:hypothetical protein
MLLGVTWPNSDISRAKEQMIGPQLALSTK